MSYISVVVFGILLYGCRAVEYKFPDGFKFGVASSAYQVEGATKEKGEDVWDRVIHTKPELIANGSNADVACDSYHLWRRDIEMLEELGVNMYRFSISWTRLLPTGFSNIISEDGKRYYNDLIDGLLQKGIEPAVTLYHYDLPQSLEDLGGWSNPLIANWFADYAETVFSLYADRVKIWVTLNEPFGICEFVYGGINAPFYNDLQLARYLCNKNVLIAHAKAYRVYDELYRPKYHGKVSLATVFFWFEPATPDDEEVTKLAYEFWEGRYAHAIFSKEGGWPKRMEVMLNDLAVKEGYSHPRLAPFTADEIKLVKGTYDFYGLNHYTTFLINKVKKGEKQGEWPLSGIEELQVNFGKRPDWKPSALNWFSVYPEGLRHQLNYLTTTYDVKEIIILENGLVTDNDSLVDTDRLEYIRDYLEQIALAADNDSVPITGYTVWTMMDNFEWATGYNTKFGLYAVNFTDPNRTRTPRESAHFYARVAKSRTLSTVYDQLNEIL